jgi:hypothetical protein
MPKRTTKPSSFEALIERKPLKPGLERRLRKLALNRAPASVARWRNAESEIDRFHAVPAASMAAYLLEERDLARQLANQAIALAQMHRSSWNYGNAVHYGHTVLGLLALAQGDHPLAIAELRASGETPGSPQLNSFGPTMQLASELLRLGETGAVLLYFQQCSKFWEMGATSLNIWEKKVLRGATPNFFGRRYR